VKDKKYKRLSWCWDSSGYDEW